jgi:hypothetical protein
VRILVVLVGVAGALIGLAVSARQLALWLNEGYWTPIRFSTLWFAIGGPTPDRFSFRPAEAFMSWLLDQPLSVVLLVSGACIAWLGIERQNRPWTRV